MAAASSRKALRVASFIFFLHAPVRGDGGIIFKLFEPVKGKIQAA
jgi:hypothetical protein